MHRSPLEVRQRIAERKYRYQRTPKAPITEKRIEELRIAARKRMIKTRMEREELQKLSREEYYQQLVERYQGEIAKIRYKIEHLPPPSKRSFQQSPEFLQLEIDRLENVIRVTKEIAAGTYDESYGLGYLADYIAKKRVCES